MAYEFYLGIDTSEAPRRAMAIVEKASSGGLPRYALRAAEAFSEDASDDACAARAQDIIAGEPYTGHTLVVVNRTGRAGGKMTDLIAGEGLTPVGVTITPGAGAGQADTGIVGTGRKGGDEAGFNASAAILYANLRELYRSGQLNTADLDLPAVSQLLGRLHDDDGDAPGDPSLLDEDPLYRAIALACWYGERRSFDVAETLQKNAETREENDRPEDDRPVDRPEDRPVGRPADRSAPASQ